MLHTCCKTKNTSFTFCTFKFTYSLYVLNREITRLLKLQRMKKGTNAVLIILKSYVINITIQTQIVLKRNVNALDIYRKYIYINNSYDYIQLIQERTNHQIQKKKSTNLVLNFLFPFFWNQKIVSIDTTFVKIWRV